MRTDWGRFHFCQHCLDRHWRALQPKSTQYLDKVYDYEKDGL